MGAQVIGIVVAAAQHVGAQDDPPLDLLAEPLAARLAVKLDRVRTVDTFAVADAVKAGEVGRSLGRRDDALAAAQKKTQVPLTSVPGPPGKTREATTGREPGKSGDYTGPGLPEP